MQVLGILHEVKINKGSNLNFDFKILKDGDHDSRSAAQFSSKINMKRGPITFFFVLLNNNKKKNGGIYTPGVKL